MTADLAGQITEFGIGVAPAGISAAKMLRAPKSPKFPQRYSQGPVTFENVADDLAKNKPSVKNAPEVKPAESVPSAKVDSSVGPTPPNTTRGWRVGQPINNLTSAGNVPSWTTVRQRFWKNEAHYNPGNYNADNLARMQRGLAPQRINPRTGQLESMELHHTPPQREGGLFDVRPVWPDNHALIDPFRHTGN